MSIGTSLPVINAVKSDIELWEYWGFEPWAFRSMSGVKRRVTFIKPALIGDVAKYYAEDSIIWEISVESDKEKLWEAVSPKEDLMTQRFLFIEDHKPPVCRIKSFMWGLRGYLEFHSYWPSVAPNKERGGEAKHDARLKDLISLVDRAVEFNSGKIEN